MIKTFAQAWLEDFWHTGKHKRVPSELEARLLRKMDMLNPPSFPSSSLGTHLPAKLCLASVGAGQRTGRLYGGQ